jgi:hypothetical protein
MLLQSLIIFSHVYASLSKANPEDAKTRALMTEAFTYGTSAKGILGAAVKGDGFTFMKYVLQLVTSSGMIDGHSPHLSLASFVQRS